jgi:Ethanolamine utilization protein EutJ (predicted chaperonin)
VCSSDLILSPGLQLLDNLNKTINGMIAVEQTKRDRSLNQTMIIVGIGLGASQITTLVMIAQNRPEPETPFYQTSAFLGGIFTGILTSAIAALIIGIIPRILRK